jgi:hypothetical protein
MVELHTVYRDFLFIQCEPWRYSLFSSDSSGALKGLREYNPDHPVIT